MNPTETIQAPTLRSDQALQQALHRLWTDHAIWTREYVVAAIAQSPDAGAAANRLLRNQEDIGNAIVPLYGEAAGAALTDLLKQHIVIAVDLVAAAMAGDHEAFGEADGKWDRNAVDIAEFLGNANPNWDKRDVHDLIAQHLELTRGEVVARLTKDWAKDITAFDDIMTELLTLSDALAAGIVKQFSDRFGVGEHPDTDDPAWGLRRAMDRLWSDHAFWTRNYIVAGLAGSEDAGPAAERLLRNQEDIGNALVPFYGEQAGAGLTVHLKQHILIAAEMVGMAHKRSFGEPFEELEARWSQNAAHIAGYLNALNPYWPLADVQDLLGQHLFLTLKEVQARYEEDWESDVQYFDDILTEILTMSGALSAGLVRQFPDRFAKPADSIGRVPVPAAANGSRLPQPPAPARRAPEPSPAPIDRSPEPAPVERSPEPSSYRTPERSSQPENESGGRMVWRSTFRNAVFSHRAEPKR
ncbi:MAG TPA: hypothetical protein VHI31_00890 [Actinomycetota bacterium]|nr:hypothetical protein [Actinomycetota bacterium]